jgi:hypothetical protein
LSKNVLSNFIRNNELNNCDKLNVLNNCDMLKQTIEYLLKKDIKDNDYHKDDDHYERDENKKFISKFLNEFFGTDKY